MFDLLFSFGLKRRVSYACGLLERLRRFLARRLLGYWIHGFNSRLAPTPLANFGEPTMVLPPFLRILHKPLGLIDRFFEPDPINDQLLKARRIDMRFTKGQPDLLEIVTKGIHGIEGMVETINKWQAMIFPVLTTQKYAI
jgi:hypothetical protein